MITRIVNKLGRLQRGSILVWFSTYDDFNDDDNDKGKKLFFKKIQPKKDIPATNDKPKEESPPKTRFFQGNRSENEGPRRIQKLGRSQSKEAASPTNKPAPFINTVIEQEEQMGKKSIFFTQTPANDESSKQKQSQQEHEPQLKQLIPSTGSDDKFYLKFSEESQQVLNAFLTRNWQTLNSTIQGYLKLTTQDELEKLVYPLFITKNILIFLEWQQYSSRQLLHLSPSLQQKVYLALIKHAQFGKLTGFLDSLATKPINLNYNSIDTLMTGIDGDSKLMELQTSLHHRIGIALSILKIQFKYNENLRASKSKEGQTPVQLGDWFSKIANIVLVRHVCRSQFQSIFQQIVIRHRQYINLQQFFQSDLFLQLIETYYYNSHIDTTKLFLFFEKAIATPKWRVVLQKLKKSLGLFKIKHNKSAFPNAKDILKELERSLDKGLGERAMFYYILAAHNDEPTAYKLLSKNASLFKTSREGWEGREGERLFRFLINDGLLSLSKDDIRSQPRKKQKFIKPDSEDKVKEEQGQQQFKIEKDYRTIIEDEIAQQSNPYRSQLLRMIFEQPPLIGAKAAMKLGKLELAFYICYRHFMSFRILSRTRNDIVYAVHSLVLEANENKYEPFLDDIKQSIRPAVFSLNVKSIYEIYHKRQNLDELFCKLFPKRTDKYQFWQNQFVLDRADELLKMDVSNKLKDMKYQPEYDQLPLRQKDQFMTQNSNFWRGRLLYELGIYEGKSTRPWVSDFVGWQDRKPWVDRNQKTQEGAEAVSLESAPEATSQITEESVAAQTTSENINEGQTLEAVQSSNEVDGEPIDAAEAINAEKLPETEVLPETEELPEAEQIPQIKDDTPTLFKKMLKRDERLRIKGYDFNNFLELTRSQIRPMFQKQYEDEKQFKKTFLQLQAIAEEACILDNHLLQKRLDECRSQIKSRSTIRLLKRWKMWHYDFLRVYSARAYPHRARTFRERFFAYQSYQGRHIVPLSSLNVPTRLEEFLRVRKLSTKMVNDMLVKQRKYFDQAEALVKLRPSREVEDLMIWGLQNDQPMSIYIAEKIAMLTNQVIGHEVALRVGEYLSHRREIPAERIERCKESLKIVGRINRQNIYDFSKDYQHITTRKNFSNYIKRRQAQLDSPTLQFLMRVDPLIKNNEEPIEVLNGLKRGRLLS